MDGGASVAEYSKKEKIIGQVIYKGLIHDYTDKDPNGYKVIIGVSGDKYIYEWASNSDCEEVETNPILEEVKVLLEKQTNKGIQKYGTTVKTSDYSLIQWIDHTCEELVDATVYLTTLKHKLRELIR